MKKGVSIFVDADGKSIDALARMIQLRGEHLGETSKDATVAAVIDVLLSLRASTRSAVKRQRFPGVKIRRRADLRPSWRGYAQRCLRMGESVFTPPNNMAVVWHEVKGFKDRDLKVFEVVPEHENNRPYFVVAAGEKAAKECEKKRALRRVKNYGGIARRARHVGENLLRPQGRRRLFRRQRARRRRAVPAARAPRVRLHGRVERGAAHRRRRQRRPDERHAAGVRRESLVL
jgi:hypothetical protein